MDHDRTPLLPVGCYIWFCVAMMVGFVIAGAGLLILDPRYGWLWVAITLPAGLACIAVPLLSIPKQNWRALVWVSVAWFLAIFVARVSIPPMPSRAEIERSGSVIVEGLEAWRAGHGTYPATLKEAGLSSPRYRCGPWRYARTDDGRFRLSIGVYHLDGFVVWWGHDDGSWHWDT